MSFFDDLGKKVSEAAQLAAKKSSNLLEIAKLNMAITAEEDKIEKAYAKIGKQIFAKYNSKVEVDPDVVSICEEIKVYQENLANLKSRLMDLKDVKLCIRCNAELDKSALFCPKCGTKQEKQSQEEQPHEKQHDETSQSKERVIRFCSKCGAEVTEGAVFCQNCGSKIQ